MMDGSSSPTPVRFKRRDTGHSRRALSAAGRSASAPSEPLSQASKSSARSSTGMRSWYGVIHSDAPDTITVQERISSFDAGSIQRSQSPAKARIGEPSATVNKCSCLRPPRSSTRKTARGNDAAPALEGVAEHRLFGDRLRAREGRRGLLQALFPEVRHEAPA